MALKEEREKLGKLAAEVRKHADDFQAAGKRFTTESRSAWDKVNADYDTQAKLVEGEQKLERQEKEVAERVASIVEAESTPNNPLRPEEVREIAMTGEHCMETSMRAWAKMGDDRLTDEISEQERKAFTSHRRYVYGRQGRGVKIGPIDRNNFCVLLDGGYGLGRRVSGRAMQRSELEFRMRHTMSLARSMGLSASEARAAMGVSVESMGGALSPEGFVYSLEKGLRAYGGIRERATVRRTESGSPLPLPTIVDATAGSSDPVYGGASVNVGELLGENKATGLLGVAPTVGALILGAYKFSSKMFQISHELIRDSAFNMPAYAGETCGERIGRISAQKWAVGSGAGIVPRGIVLDAPVSYALRVANAIDFDDMTDFLYTVDPAYREMDGACWLMHDKFIKNLRKIKDGLGRYIWQSSNVGHNGDVKEGEPERLLDKPVQRVMEMPYDFNGACIDGSTQTPLIVFGCIPKYQIREVQMMRLRRLVERFAEYDQEAFIGFLEADGGLLDPGTRPVKALANNGTTLGSRFQLDANASLPGAGEMADLADETRGIDETRPAARVLDPETLAMVRQLVSEAVGEAKKGNGRKAKQTMAAAEDVAKDAVSDAGEGAVE